MLDFLSSVPSVRILLKLLRRYTVHDVAREGAALAYYLLFSLFPLLILTSSLIGQLSLDISGILRTLSIILPVDVLRLVENYLIYVSENTNRAMLWFSLVFSVWFPMRATGSLMGAVRRAYELPPPRKRIRYAFRVAFYTGLLLFSITLTLLLATLGRDAVAAIASTVGLPGEFSGLWQFARFLLLGLVAFGALAALYAAAQDMWRGARAILPGAVLSTLSWIALSALYSFYAEFLSNYDLIYGTLGAVIVLLIWLYLTALVLILGAEINALLVPSGTGSDTDQGETL